MRFRTRHPQWETRLADVVAAWQGRAYRAAWGADSGAFVLDAIEAVAGERLIDGGEGYTSKAGRLRWLKARGWGSFVVAADELLGEQLPALAAHRGDVVTDGQTLGIRTGAGYAAFTPDGLTLMAPSSIVAAWPIGRAD